jgi:predicted metal-dependent peptidase
LSSFREWYAGAAAGPKDVVIVIDTSGSMRTANRMQTAINAAKTVVDTLTDADYATVIGFQSYARKMTTSLRQATRTQRAAMRNWIDSNLMASGGTHFRGAMQAVFDVLTASTTFGTSTSGVCSPCDGSNSGLAAPC